MNDAVELEDRLGVHNAGFLRFSVK
jgi:hypothetical protein